MSRKFLVVSIIVIEIVAGFGFFVFIHKVPSVNLTETGTVWYLGEIEDISCNQSMTFELKGNLLLAFCNEVEFYSEKVINPVYYTELVDITSNKSHKQDVTLNMYWWNNQYKLAEVWFFEYGEVTRWQFDFAWLTSEKP